MTNSNGSQTSSASSHTEAFQTLGHVAFLANRLAKQLSGRERALAYQIKAQALSALVVGGVATVNGRHTDNTLGIDVFNSRLHCPYSSLTSQAQSLVDRRTRSLRQTTPMVDLLSPAELQILADVTRRRAA